MAKPTLTIGLIGYQFMGKAHSNAYRQVNHFFDLPYQVRMKTICGRTEASVQQAACDFGWEQAETDWKSVVSDPEIDVIDVCTPGESHCEITCAAAEAGKIVWCEKPAANTLEEAERMATAVAKSGKPSLIFHNYRCAPAVAYAQQLIQEGLLGELRHFRGTYLQDWLVDPHFPMNWRMDKARAGSGALGDIASHVIDLAHFLVGEIEEVSAMLHTFISERNLPDNSGKSQVTVDDASLFLARFKSGTIGTFEATRMATGRKNYNRFEINGSKGSLAFNMERMNELELYLDSDTPGQKGFRTINVTESCHPFTGNYWPAGHIIGYEHTFTNTIANAIRNLETGERTRPDMQDGLMVQRVMDAVERSWNTKSWTKPL